MDKYEYKVKLAQIEKLVAKKDYVTAAKIADGIDWRKVKSVTTLDMIADIYEATDRLEDCYEILNMEYDRSPVGRAVVYRLAEIATKMHDFEEAIDLYKEFVRIAPHDLSKYILKYQIYRERGSSVADQIVILEEFKSHEYNEKWSYELACLYEEAGMIDRCIEECDELILWFSEGEYVIKALELKKKYRELTASQQEKYDHRFEQKKSDEEDSEAYDEDEEFFEETEEDASAGEKSELEEMQMPTKEKIPASEDASEENAELNDTPQVSMINTNKFSTINLQEELARGLQMILAQDGEEKNAEADEAEAEEDTVAEDIKETIPVKTVSEKIPETLEETPKEEKSEQEPQHIPLEETREEAEDAPAKEAQAVPVKETVKESDAVPQKPAEKPDYEDLSQTAELKTEILKYAVIPSEPAMEELLTTEEDGQISLAIGEENVLEKQITGQMTIGEILEAWEEKKRQAREKIAYAEGKKQAVPFETGEISSLLKDFIPRTPKDVQQLMEELEAEDASAKTQEELLKEETPVVLTEQLKFEEVPETEETESLEEPEMNAEPEEPPVTEAECETTAKTETFSEQVIEKEMAEFFEDDLPQEIEAAEEPSVSQNTASMLDAIERALAMEVAPMETSGGYLTEEQEKIFAYFTSVNGMKKQLVKLLSEDGSYAGMSHSSIGNLIITGHPGNGKTTLAIDIVKAFQKQRQEKGGKLAKVSGDGLNKKNPEEVVKKLGGGALIIERAGSLNKETVEKLSKVMEGPTGGLLVILEDDGEEINNLLTKNERFAAKFNRSIDIPIFSNDELVAFGKSYAEEQEYFFDEMAILALYDCIGIRQTSDHVVNITEVKEFVDDAIDHAEKKSRGIFAKFSKKRIDEYGNRLLLEEDFDF